MRKWVYCPLKASWSLFFLQKWGLGCCDYYCTWGISLTLEALFLAAVVVMDLTALALLDSFREGGCFFSSLLFPSSLWCEITANSKEKSLLFGWATVVLEPWKSAGSCLLFSIASPLLLLDCCTTGTAEVLFTSSTPFVLLSSGEGGHGFFCRRLRPSSISDSSDFRFALFEQMAPIFLLGFKNNNYYYRRTQRNMKELEFSLRKFSDVHVSMNCRHRNHANWLLLLLLSLPSCHMSSPESASVSSSRLLHASQLTSVSHARFSSSCHSIILFHVFKLAWLPRLHPTERTLAKLRDAAERLFFSSTGGNRQSNNSL